MSEMDPSRAAELAKEGPAEQLPPPEDVPSDPADADSGPGLLDGLLETQPPGSVAEYPDMPPFAAHALIGTQKFINGIAGDRNMNGGKPAIVDFVQAGISLVGGESDSESEPPEPTESPPADVGGSINE